MNKLIYIYDSIIQLLPKKVYFSVFGRIFSMLKKYLNIMLYKQKNLLIKQIRKENQDFIMISWKIKNPGEEKPGEEVLI